MIRLTGILLLFFYAFLPGNAGSFSFMQFSSPAPGGEQAEVKFEKDTHNFGDIVQGSKVNFVFKCRNTGNRPLIISWVDTPCGCTSPDWTKNPIFPGSTGEVTVTYNSAGRMGAFNKTITVMSNAKSSPSELTVKGNVVKGDAGSN